MTGRAGVGRALRVGSRAAAWLLVVAITACGGHRANPPSPHRPAVSPACQPAPGVVCFGQNGWIEYLVGDLPIVISVPHGGSIEPPAIPTRTSGTTTRDLNTIETGRAAVEAFRTRTGRAPHLVICHLRRTRLDANRDVGEAAEGQPAMAAAWSEYHAFIELAIAQAARGGGSGFYIDLHGHGHAIQRLELGYLLSASELADSDARLDAGPLAATSSLRLALRSSPDSFSALLRGSFSLGGLLAPAYASVPSPDAPGPAGDPYFSGGYSTERHTSRLPGVQIEANFTGVRDTAASRAAFGAALATAVQAFAARHLGAGIPSGTAPPEVTVHPCRRARAACPYGRTNRCA